MTEARRARLTAYRDAIQSHFDDAVSLVSAADKLGIAYSHTEGDALDEIFHVVVSMLEDQP